jgi:ABC-2 type transport system permease protein
MNKILALTRANWQAMVSYRMQFVLSIASLLVMVVPIYFIAQAVQPVMADSIRTEGGHAFGFLVVGLAAFTLVSASVTALPGAVAGGIRTGVLEALMATPTSTTTLLLGLNAFDLLLAAFRGGILLTAGWIFGASLVPERLLPGVGILALIVLAHLPFGLIGAASVLAFRTAGPIPRGVLVVSGLLGGVYYPTHVIPSWLQTISLFLPLSYGLRALRKVVLQGASLSAVAPDLLALLAATLILLGLGVAVLTWALRYARRQGTLAQY